MSLPDSYGRPDMVRLPSLNPVCPPSGNTLPGNKSIIGSNRFKRSIGRFWSGIAFRSTNDTCGIDWVALSGLGILATHYPGRCPGLAWGCPFGAKTSAPTARPHGDITSAPTSRPCGDMTSAPTARPHGDMTSAPTARPNSSPGQRPGDADTHSIKALKGRPNAGGLDGPAHDRQRQDCHPLHG